MKASLFFLRVRKLLSLFTSATYLRASKSWVFASAEHEELMGLREWKTVIDVGANIGQFSLLARRHHPMAHIIAFEPMRSAAAKYRQLFSRDEKVVLHQCAIGASSGHADLHLSRASDSSSLLEIGSEQVNRFPGTEEVGLERVCVSRLADVGIEISRPSLLKIDVQGFEHQVLEGSLDVLPEIDFVYCECSFVELYTGQLLATEVITFMKETGFQLAGVSNVAYDGRTAVQADFLFRNQRLNSEG